MTSTQALFPESNEEELPEGQSLGLFQGRLSLDITDRENPGNLKDGPSMDLSTKRSNLENLDYGQSLDLTVGLPFRERPKEDKHLEEQSSKNPGRSLTSVNPEVGLLQEYEADTQMDELVSAMDIEQRDKIMDITLLMQSKTPGPSNGLYLDDVDGLMHETIEDFPDLSELQNEIAEQVAEFEKTWHLDQSKAIDEKNRLLQEEKMETELDAEQNWIPARNAERLGTWMPGNLKQPNDAEAQVNLKELERQPGVQNQADGAWTPQNHKKPEEQAHIEAPPVKTASMPSAVKVTTVGRSVQVTLNLQFKGCPSLPILQFFLTLFKKGGGRPHVKKDTDFVIAF